ncbi:MAG: hypothetical protein ABSH07_12965 [Candidatus Dormibacteria bacterium]
MTAEMLKWLRRNSPWVGGFCMGLMAGVVALEAHFTYRAVVRRRTATPAPPASLSHTDPWGRTA